MVRKVRPVKPVAQRKIKGKDVQLRRAGGFPKGKTPNRGPERNIDRKDKRPSGGIGSPATGRPSKARVSTAPMARIKAGKALAARPGRKPGQGRPTPSLSGPSGLKQRVGPIVSDPTGFGGTTLRQGQPSGGPPVRGRPVAGFAGRGGPNLPKRGGSGPKAIPPTGFAGRGGSTTPKATRTSPAVGIKPPSVGGAGKTLPITKPVQPKRQSYGGSR